MAIFPHLAARTGELAVHLVQRGPRLPREVTGDAHLLRAAGLDRGDGRIVALVAGHEQLASRGLDGRIGEPAAV